MRDKGKREEGMWMLGIDVVSTLSRHWCKSLVRYVLQLVSVGESIRQSIYMMRRVWNGLIITITISTGK